MPSATVLGLLGTKRSCELSVCGSCTVLLDGEPYTSCMTLAIEAEGRRLTTIQGAGQDGALSDVQRAFVEEVQAVQMRVLHSWVRDRLPCPARP